MQTFFEGVLPFAWKRTKQYAPGVIALALAAAAFPAAAADGPPSAPLPPDARRFDVSADTFKLNGLPARVSGFLSSRSPDDVAKWYRQQLGEPVADNYLGNRRILGREREGHYITVQLEPTGGGTRGLVSVASLKDMQRNHEAELAARERWQNRLPAGSRLLSHVNSEDAGQGATFIAFVNRHDESLNQESLRHVLREEGLELERAAGSSAEPAASDGRAGSGTTLYFKGKGKEAMATVFRTSDAKTAVILNITTMTGTLTGSGQ